MASIKNSSIKFGNNVNQLVMQLPSSIFGRHTNRNFIIGDDFVKRHPPIFGEWQAPPPIPRHCSLYPKKSSQNSPDVYRNIIDVPRKTRRRRFLPASVGLLTSRSELKINL
jgi:hypothetical protein